MTIKKVITFLLVILAFSAKADLYYDTLYINSGHVNLGMNDSLHLTLFTESSEFDGKSLNLKFLKDDALELCIINLDSFPHTPGIKGETYNWKSLAMGDTARYSFSFNEFGIHILEDLDHNELFRYAGLASTITVYNEYKLDFHWNIKDINKDWSNQISTLGTEVARSEYEPDFFLLNDLRNPGIDEDTTAKVRASKGETILIFITNSGSAIHSLHFHGYHGQLIYTSGDQKRLGWEKDTYGIQPGESIIIQITPDKTGEYPVHDHNLVAVTGGGYYPNGIFTTMVITE